MSVFENHVHALKRTHPLTGGQISENGVVYFGDGTFGAIATECKLNTGSKIFAKVGAINNFWVSYLNRKEAVH
jgi:hypothetical protein